MNWWQLNHLDKVSVMGAAASRRAACLPGQVNWYISSASSTASSPSGCCSVFVIYNVLNRLRFLVLHFGETRWYNPKERIKVQFTAVCRYMFQSFRFHLSSCLPFLFCFQVIRFARVAVTTCGFVYCSSVGCICLCALSGPPKEMCGTGLKFRGVWYLCDAKPR